MKKYQLIIAFVFSMSLSAQQKIDRKALVTRHNVQITSIDTLASLTVGNGSFAFTVDATGLQTFLSFMKMEFRFDIFQEKSAIR